MGTVTTLTISAEHPAFQGHFPGAPILPGAVLLDETLRAAQLENSPRQHWQIGSAKFVKPVRPGEPLTLECERLPSGSLRFAIRSAGRLVANGTLIPSAQSDA